VRAGLRGSRWRGVFKTATLLATATATAGLLGLAACDPPIYFDTPEVVGNGKAAVSWTLNMSALTESTCTAQRISWMRVTIISRSDPRLGAEFLNVACGLDRYSVAMTPEGPVRIVVDAVHQSGRTGCIRYSGSVDTQATAQFPTTPAQVQLKPVSECP